MRLVKITFTVFPLTRANLLERINFLALTLLSLKNGRQTKIFHETKLDRERRRASMFENRSENSLVCVVCLFVCLCIPWSL